MSEFSKWLTDYLKDIDQRTFAKHAGVSQATISFWKNGKSEPKDKNIRKLSELTSVSVPEIYRKLGRPIPGIDPPPENTDDERSWLINIIVRAMERLPESDQQIILDLTQSLLEKQEAADKKKG